MHFSPLSLEFLKGLNHTPSKLEREMHSRGDKVRRTVHHRCREVFSEFAACVMSVLRWLAIICAMPEGDTRKIPRTRVLSHMCGGTKISDKRDRCRGTLIRFNSARSDFVSRRPSQIASPILITTRLSYDRLFISDRLGDPPLRFHRSTYSFTAYVHHAT